MLGAGAKHPPSVYAIAGYRQEMSEGDLVEALDPDAKRDMDIEARASRKAEQLERAHREWLAEAGIDGD
jgi:hypothetical protein